MKDRLEINMSEFITLTKGHIQRAREPLRGENLLKKARTCQIKKGRKKWLDLRSS